MLDRVNLILKNKDFIKYYNNIIAFESDRIFCKHDMEHILNVARIMIIKDGEYSKPPVDKDIIYALAVLHDLGRAIQYASGIDHNIAGGQLAKEILPQCNYNNEEIELISSRIINHNKIQATSYLSHLLHYADKLSRNCFVCSAKDLCNWSDEKKNIGIEI
ncbi:MAG: HD domain-containing protein [Spirochaetaceae bacterium]|nr:HD domain-containing protein [Spirochaetaceae bacterium]